MKLPMSPLIFVIMCCVEMTAPVGLFAQEPRHLIDIGRLQGTASDGADKAALSSAPVNINASDSHYVFPETSITSIVEPIREKATGDNPRLFPQCILTGHPCTSSLSCCSQRCVFHGGSTRVGYICM